MLAVPAETLQPRTAAAAAAVPEPAEEPEPAAAATAAAVAQEAAAAQVAERLDRHRAHLMPSEQEWDAAGGASAHALQIKHYII